MTQVEEQVDFSRPSDWYSDIPDYLWEPMCRYVQLGRPCGHFLTSVVQNDLFKAVGHADEAAIGCIRKIVAFFYSISPSVCHGSPGRAKAWLKVGGQAGYDKLSAEEQRSMCAL